MTRIKVMTKGDSDSRNCYEFTTNRYNTDEGGWLTIEQPGGKTVRFPLSTIEYVETTVLKSQS